MNAMKNLIHGGILAVWALLGLTFTLRCLFGPGAGMATLLDAGSWWLWFAGFVGVTTAAVARFRAAVAPLILHGAALIALHLIPRLFPLSLLRLGIDLLQRA